MSEANKTIIRRLLQECFNQHKIDLYPEFYSGTFVQRTPAMGELGSDAHRQLLISLFAHFPTPSGRLSIKLGRARRLSRAGLSWPHIWGRSWA